MTSRGEQLSLVGVDAASQPVSLLDAPLVFVDIETNGMNHIRGRVIEVAAIRVEHGIGGPRITREFNQLIDPGTELPAFITSLTGIRPEDLRGAQPFRQIARELHDILSGAIFVAHNVRFDYSFLKQEFKRAGLEFLPRQLCTVKLSRALYPEFKSHKLEALIARHGFSYQHRHRAYDDAHVLWQFVQHCQQEFPASVIEAAVKKQLRQPALPRNLPPGLVGGLPASPGVYIMEDDSGSPLYIGKSINIRSRVLQHFGRDHDDSKEFKIAQTVKHVTAHQTPGELSALLLESRLVKEIMPLYNRQLRRTQKLLVARLAYTSDGYATVSLEESSQLDPDDLESILAVYARRSSAKNALNDMVRLQGLCPKLLGLEKSKSACFLSQLGKCRGACAGREAAASYNLRLQLAFERQRIADWPYPGPVLVQEKLQSIERDSDSDSDQVPSSGIIIDKWCVLAEITQPDDCAPTVTTRSRVFDLDTYKILQSYLAHKLSRLIVRPLSTSQLSEFLQSPA